MNARFAGRGLALFGLALGAALSFSGSASAQVVPAEIQAAINATTSAVISAVTRPSSPFVTGIASDIAPNTCGLSPWARAQAGAVSSTTGGATVDVRYVGTQLNADYGCFNINGTGLDITAGGEVGKLWATGNQPATPTATATLDQTYFGGYATAAKGGFAGDIEVRRELNTFTANNIPAVPNGTQLGVNRTIVNVAGSYAIGLPNNFSLVPAAGLSVISTDGTSVVLPAGTAAINAGTGAVGYVGATVANTIVLADQATALQPFLTGTYYNDFGTSLVGTLTTPLGVTTAVLAGPGNYGEISLGLNLIKVLDNTAGGPRQFSATVRGDYRFNSTFQGFNLTGQARIQF